MGSDPSVDSLAFDLESWGEGQRQGRVLLPTFYMGRFEVTVAQFAAFVFRHWVPCRWTGASTRGATCRAPTEPTTAAGRR